MLCLKYHNVLKCFVRPLNVHFSSNRNRNVTSEWTLIRQTLDQDRLPTTKEWTELREKLRSMKRSNNYNNTSNFDRIIVGCCLPTQLDIGKSYVKHLKESGTELNTGTLVDLLKLYYRASKAGTEITPNDQQEIINMYKLLREKFDVFDSTLSEATIMGLVLTTEWRKSVEILESIKFASNPSSSMYSVIIQRALQEKDEHLACSLLNDMVTQCEIIKNEVFVAYIEFCEKNAKTFTEQIDKILSFIGDKEILVTTKVIKDFCRAFQKFGYNCSLTTINQHGQCRSCQKCLRSVYITDDEFNSLSSHFLDKAFIGNNIFAKTTPQEMDSFIKFIDTTKPYDYVIDGLNVAYKTHLSNHLVLAKNLASVVKHFADRKMKILVIGRKHMNSWPKEQMNYIRQNSNLFLTDNLSEDDPFFLYSTLKSGPNTDFITCDLIRDHAFNLDKNLKSIFRLWQQQHQYMIKWIGDNGRITFELPNKFDMNAHQVDGCWHIPFENDNHCTLQRMAFELRKNWLCVSKGG